MTKNYKKANLFFKMTPNKNISSKMSKKLFRQKMTKNLNTAKMNQIMLKNNSNPIAMIVGKDRIEKSYVQF